MDLKGDWLGECRVDPVGSGWGPVAGCCEYGDEPAGSGATELVRDCSVHTLHRHVKSKFRVSMATNMT
jgi:hypothetical protein